MFDAIRLARPSRLYIAADGPRAERPNELKQCAEVRKIVAEVDWPCEVHELLRPSNLGCRVAVTGALDWFFECEEAGIVLEDDCVPDPTFFRFCSELLERYRDDARIAMISANDYHSPDHHREHSYSFTRYTFIWGWATWRRAWTCNDPALAGWPQLRESSWLADLSDGHSDFVRYWTERFDETRARTVDSWAYAWTYSCWRAGMISAMPTSNLCLNVGFGTDATHTTGDDWRAHLPSRPMSFPLVHPTVAERDPQIDRWADLNVYYTAVPAPSRWRKLAAALPGARRLMHFLRGDPSGRT